VSARATGSGSSGRSAGDSTRRSAPERGSGSNGERPAAWLLKTEPSSYSWDDLVREGRAVWDGVTNPVALANIRRMAKGDMVVIYHTGGEKSAVGLGRVVRTAYPDPKAKEERLVVVDVEAGKPLPRPVTLAEIKAHPAFRESPLVRQGRLSVVPLTDAQLKVLSAASSG
jgi:predicted RNA-binding protein with PUA-like domain